VTGPLAGVRVLDLSRFAPGAYCTLLLADLGADVVKVEAPGDGDGLRGRYGGGFDAAHVALNRGKRSVALDLRHDRAPEVLERLVAWSHVVVESHRPGQLDRFGLGYDAMTARHPHVVWCSITGFGDFGPNAEQPGHDLTYLGASGLLSRLAEGNPTPPGTVVSLPLAATMASTGILAALHEAQRTGRGTRLDANMTDSAMWVRSEHRPCGERARAELGQLRREERLRVRRRSPHHADRERAPDVGRALRRARRHRSRRAPPRHRRRRERAPAPGGALRRQACPPLGRTPRPRRRHRTRERRRRPRG
jgi:crotonobetainyl-CoA:carnitine CoA-transferase CaiB-like acyl-CoA transferase